MEIIYTEAMLKPLKKVQLYEILLAKGVEVNKNASSDNMIALILANNPPAPDETAGRTPTENTPPSTTSDEGDKSGDDADPPAPDNGANELEPDDLQKFSKEQLLKSSTYSHRRDVLEILLDEDTGYSHAQILELLDEFYKKAVK